MNSALRESYRQCARQARRAASSFYWSLWLLPPEQRNSMFSLYAFARRSDDLADSSAPVETRRAELAAWREAFSLALAEDFRDPLLPALADTLRRFQIPREYLEELLAGVETDLGPPDFATREELRQYCYRVASVVGLACIRIWGVNSLEAAEPAAIECGQAFQLTNILRDLGEDAARGRVYLPRETLTRFDLTRDELLLGEADGRLAALLEEECRRAECMYTEAAGLEMLLATAAGRRAFRAMFNTYRGLLEAVRRSGLRGFTHRVRLSTGRKLSIVGSTLLRR